ncbi:MAG: CpsD/CapB family tyrosine-protein kinase [Planctomycetes bacterium]|nr:CpsD/CapB family tyrosine-protein kinase [Planctomycetota bacterium]
MGRTLEALKQATTRRDPRQRVPQAAKDAPPLQAVWPEDVAQETGVPFVEVGGPRATPQAPPATAPVVVPPSPVAPDGPRLMTVLFRPLPFEPATRPSRSRFALELVAYHQPDHAISGQYRDLSGRIVGVVPGERARVLLFTSAGAATGTTTVLLNTAITVARQSGRRVVVVDAHLRRAAVAARLGLGEAPGLREVLAGRLPLNAAVRPTGLPGLSALTAGAADAAPPARLAGEGMRAVLRQLREQFDLVLVDGPPWDGRPEVVALGCACDAVYLCLPEAAQETPETVDLLQVIPEQGANLCGCVLTSR